jgi:hypothetical protein
MKVKGMFIAVVAACLSSAVTDADAVIVGGARSCGSWMESHNSGESSWTGIAAESWVMGYLSGLAVGKNKNFLDGIDSSSLYLWITNYCRANPLDNTATASELLGNELIRRKGL